jgi:hypothetical protein
MACPRSCGIVDQAGSKQLSRAGRARFERSINLAG